MYASHVTPNFGQIYKRFTITARRLYAAKPTAAAASKMMAPQPAEDQSFIDMDTEKLTKYCCCTYLKGGTDTPLKPDSEYPAWLFNLRLGPPPTLDELDPSDITYWKRYDEFSIKERLERRKLYYSSLYTQQWLEKVKKIPEDEVKGDVEEYEVAEGSTKK